MALDPAVYVVRRNLSRRGESRFESPERSSFCLRLDDVTGSAVSEDGSSLTAAAAAAPSSVIIKSVDNVLLIVRVVSNVGSI